MSTIERWRGLAALVTDSVEGGSRAIERIQKETAQQVFAVLELLPPLAPSARLLRTVHTFFLGTTHRAVRLVNAGVRTTVDIALVSIEEAGRGGSSSEN
jgi:hypothetical protein